MTELSLRRDSPRGSRWSVRLPDPLVDCWCALRLSVQPPLPCRVALELQDDGGRPHLRIVIPRLGTAAPLVLYPSSRVRGLRVRVFAARAISEVRISARPLSRLHAALMMFARAPGRIARAAIGSPAGLAQRVRGAMLPAPQDEDYDLWRDLFDHWPDDASAYAGGSTAAIEYLIVCPAGRGSTESDASIESVRGQIRPASFRTLKPDQAVRAALAGSKADYIGILQAGETLVPHATALIGAWIAREGEAPALCADEDRVDPVGRRHAPHFKPQPNRALMLSGTLTRGLWLFRRDWLLAEAPTMARWAEPLRLHLWLRLHERGEAERTRRMPFLLSSRRDGTERAPAAALVEIVEAHLARIGQRARVDTRNAGRLHISPRLADGGQRRVSLVIPSALMDARVTSCLRAVLDTEHEGLDAFAVVSQPGPLTQVQSENLAAIGPKAPRVVMLPVERFNYAQANNEVVRRSDAEFVCLLNDDVAPIAPGWLDAMLGWFADPDVAAVGARLLYPDRRVQHAGVIAGLAGVADHAHRFLPAGADGYFGRARLSQEVSVATGACLLVRRAVYEQVGGMDESFPVAFNDVDFCLRLREAGHRIVYCAEAELTHYESLSLGSHFSGERIAVERLEVQRMRARWRQAIAADPFHNPNLSLEPGREWQPAFPPRISRNRYLKIAGDAPPKPAERQSLV